MSESEVLNALADAFDAASRVLRERASVRPAEPLDQSESRSAVERARSIRPSLGPRQAQIIGVLEQHGVAGTNTGVVSRAISYSQPNVHLTLMGLMDAGLVERDSNARPHLYRLSAQLLADS